MRQHSTEPTSRAMLEGMEAIIELAGTLRRAADLLDVIAKQAAECAPREGPQLRRLLSYQEASTYLGISLRGMKDLASNGKVRKVQIGARVLFDRSDLDEYVERLR